MQVSDAPQPAVVKRDLYYTTDHEWIDFQGAVAYVGFCAFKLKGIKQIREIVFADMKVLLKSGDVIASVFYDDYKINVHMPVDGRVVQINDAILGGNHEMVLQQPEAGGWIALVVPVSPDDRKNLLISEQYRMRAALR